MADPGLAREYVVACDTGGKEPVRKLVKSKKTTLLQTAKRVFGVTGNGYELEYYHAKLEVYIRPDTARHKTFQTTVSRSGWYRRYLRAPSSPH